MSTGKTGEISRDKCLVSLSNPDWGSVLYCTCILSLHISVMWYTKLYYRPFFWLLVIYSALCARHMVMGGQEDLRVSWVVKTGVFPTSLSVFCSFDIKEPNCFCLLQPA